MSSKQLVAFVLGVVLGALLARAPAVEAVESALMFGRYNNAAKAVQVDSNGAVKVTLN